VTRPEPKGAIVADGPTLRITGTFTLAWLTDGKLAELVSICVGPDAHGRIDGDGILFFRPSPSGVSDDHRTEAADPAQDPRAGRQHD
jgi:hypothetical protein